MVKLMTQYIDKSALVAEIKTRIETYNKGYANGDDCRADALETFLHDIDFLEVKDANEALRTEYEKGRADVIADTLSWLENCWPKYCSNQTIIDGFKEAIKD